MGLRTTRETFRILWLPDGEMDHEYKRKPWASEKFVEGTGS